MQTSTQIDPNDWKYMIGGTYETPYVSPISIFQDGNQYHEEKLVVKCETKEDVIKAENAENRLENTVLDNEINPVSQEIKKILGAVNTAAEAARDTEETRPEPRDEYNEEVQDEVNCAQIADEADVKKAYEKPVITIEEKPKKVRITRKRKVAEEAPKAVAAEAPKRRVNRGGRRKKE